MAHWQKSLPNHWHQHKAIFVLLEFVLLWHFYLNNAWYICIQIFWFALFRVPVNQWLGRDFCQWASFNFFNDFEIFNGPFLVILHRVWPFLIILHRLWRAIFQDNGTIMAHGPLLAWLPLGVAPHMAFTTSHSVSFIGPKNEMYCDALTQWTIFYRKIR